MFRRDLRQTLPVATRLAAILRRDARPFTSHACLISVPSHIPRFALLLCFNLRSKGIPARVRCGFASYSTTIGKIHCLRNIGTDLPGTGAERSANGSADCYEM